MSEIYNTNFIQSILFSSIIAGHGGVNLGLNLVFLKTQVLMAFFSMYNSDIFQYYLNCRGCLFKRFRIFQFFAEKCSLQAKIIKVDPLLEKYLVYITYNVKWVARLWKYLSRYLLLKLNHALQVNCFHEVA